MIEGKCHRAIYAALKSGRELTCMELSRRTGHPTPTIYRALANPKFEKCGVSTSAWESPGPAPVAYKLAPIPEPQPEPPARNPAVEDTLNDCAIMSMAIKVLRRRGHAAAALKVAEAWQHEDRRLKRVFEEAA